MKPKLSFNRRDFLKLLALASAPLIAKTADQFISLDEHGGSDSDAKGVIIIVLDALSALNLSLHGYHRKTSANIDRFARRSTVYHAHYSAANFTSSGTASLLTGTYPWTHRAFHYEGLISSGMVDSNLFRYWGDSSIRLGYTQNAWADLLLYQFSPWLDMHLDLQQFNLNKAPFYRTLFGNDPISSYRSTDSFALELQPGLSAVSFLALIRKANFYIGKKTADSKFAEDYPLGIPQTLNDIGSYYLLEDLFDGLMKLIKTFPPATLAYLHLYPPHYPFAPRQKFVDTFMDGWQPPVKPPAHFLKSVEEETLDPFHEQRDSYDAFIASVDEDFGRLFDFMEREGILDHNYVVLTSDHGDIYERGVGGHTNEYLYEPLVRVPLLISSPGQVSQVDVHTPSSSVDLLPTLLALTGRPAPDVCEGVLLPGLGGKEDAQRSIFSIDTKTTHVKGQIQTATISLRKGQYKLIAYLGYEGFEDGFELYDLQNDPEEMNDLFRFKPETASELQHELEEKLRQVNAPYTHF